MRVPRIVPLLLLLTLVGGVAHAKKGARSGIEFAGQTASAFQGATFDKQSWAKEKWAMQMNQQFPNQSIEMKQWDKHFSPWGKMRAPLTMSEERDKKMFKSEKIKFSEKQYELARWNQQMADLKRDARVSTGDEAYGFSKDAEHYTLQLQDARYFREIADKMSLRDVNRYAFQRNIASAEVPVQAAGRE